ncbi:MAG: proline--tRNA ligase, partial [Deltaproteobacteria bacterium]|nr:proline--tRNA ligase [Deltaproteobacteria bacterium]
GTKYSKAMGATFLDAKGQERAVEMGCYGIGITRLMAAAVEQNHDENGIIWSFPLAPFQVLLLPINYKEKAVREVTDDLYQKLSQNGLEILLDDRDERPGVKFKDADLIGVPIRVTLGAKGLQKGNVEVRKRLGGETVDVPVADAVPKIQSLVT